MRAMVFDAAGEPLRPAEMARPEPGPGQVLLRVRACAICRTDLHILDGELPDPKLPLVLGHQIVAQVAEAGPGVETPSPGERVGVPWLGWTDGTCRYCASERENLCQNARFTGYDFDGGYAEWTVVDARFCLPVPEDYPDLEAAPLLCAGLIGWRCLKMTGDAGLLGIYGFGTAARLIAQVARHQGRRVFAFTRSGDQETQRSALDLGVEWAGASTQPPPEELDAAILFAPVGDLVPAALAAVAPGGTVVCGEIHMSDIPSFPYELLWQERVLRSVANLTRADGAEFLALAPKVPVRSSATAFPLEEANGAVGWLRSGAGRGAAVLVPAAVVEGRNPRARQP
jgi:propanol-preferring alcohol dehydrogenase